MAATSVWLLLAALAPSLITAEARPPAPALPWADFVEPSFPFFSSVIDARHSGGASPANNLTSRGLVLNLGDGMWAGFDLDLLRISAAWTGSPVTPVAMAQASYQVWNRKSRGGEKGLPQPAGRVWLANGIYPGWSAGAEPQLEDPRPPAPSPEEIGRGALAPELGRFGAIHLTEGGLRIDYTVAGVAIQERIGSDRREGRPELIRKIRVEPSPQPLILVLALRPENAADAVGVALAAGPGGGCAELESRKGVWSVVVRPHREVAEFSVGLSPGGGAPGVEFKTVPPGADRPAAPRWPQPVVTRGSLSTKQDAYVVDDIALPLANPWRRNVRPADLKFLPDGTAATVTPDGDVWLIRGLSGDLAAVSWRRFASGLHEPLGLAVRDGEIFVFDRNGIWRLRDTTGAGEADDYELFSNAFAQTADGREFPNTISAAPDGSFVIAKGGEQGETTGPHNGTVIRVSADGRRIAVLGWGFRQPFAGVDPASGLVTASDQQGNYVPATPLYLVEGNRYHGFLPPFAPREQYPAPIAEPLTWIPHTICPSAVGQIWMRGTRMGPLDGSMLLLGYNYPEVFRVLLNRRESIPQAAVVSLTRDFRFPPLGGGVNPVDGSVYVAGFKIFTTASDRVAGIARLRYAGGPSLLPREVAPMRNGILLRFDVPLDPAAAAEPDRYDVERWNYRRSFEYGSLHYLLDGSVGQERMEAVKLVLSRDRKSVFLGMADLRTDVMQMQVNWKLRTQSGAALEGTADFTPRVLSEFRPAAEGFDEVAIDLTGAPVHRAPPASGSIAEGLRLSQVLGCVACHSSDGTARVGPSWKGLYGQLVILSDGSNAVMDESFIRARLAPHGGRLVLGYPAGMPDYSGVVTGSQTTALARYIQSLK